MFTKEMIISMLNTVSSRYEICDVQAARISLSMGQIGSTAWRLADAIVDARDKKQSLAVSMLETAGAALRELAAEKGLLDGAGLSEKTGRGGLLPQLPPVEE